MKVTYAVILCMLAVGCAGHSKRIRTAKETIDAVSGVGLQVFKSACEAEARKCHNKGDLSCAPLVSCQAKRYAFGAMVTSAYHGLAISKAYLAEGKTDKAAETLDRVLKILASARRGLQQLGIDIPGL